MQESPRVRAEPASIAMRLEELGVDGQILREAVHSGVGYASGCTAHDPPILGGILVWGKTIRSLRDSLVPAGWTAENKQNYATVVHPDGGYAITVAAGDAHTGVPDKTPTTRTEKGPVTRDAVAQNQLHFADIAESFRPFARRQTWLLLHFIDEEADEIRIELALPTDMTADGFVAAWVERIILSPVPLMPTVEVEGESIDVSVERRTS